MHLISADRIRSWKPFLTTLASFPLCHRSRPVGSRCGEHTALHTAVRGNPQKKPYESKERRQKQHPGPPQGQRPPGQKIREGWPQNAPPRDFFWLHAAWRLPLAPFFLARSAGEKEPPRIRGLP